MADLLGSPVEVKYSFQSTNRSSFQDPASDSCPSFRDSLPTTRFGSSPTAAAVGIGTYTILIQ